MNLPTYIDVYLDEPFRQKLNHGASEIISRIHMADFQVENTLGLMVVPINSNYMGKPQKRDKLSLEDFIGSALRKEAKGNSIPGINHECVEEFAAIFKQQYDNLLAMGILGEDSQKLEKYLDQFVSQGEYNHKEDQPFGKLLLTNLLDLTIIKPIIESCCGYDLITEEDLTDMERSLKLVFAIVDLVTLATGLYGFTLAAETMGAKEAVAYFAQLALVELAADVSATTVATIGEYCEWPAGLTILLSLGTGLTVGQVGNHLIFKQNGIEIFSKEVSESGGLLDDYLALSKGVNEGGSGHRYSVDSTMFPDDEAAGVLRNGEYVKNPTAHNINDYISEGSNYLGSKNMNGQYMYVVDMDGNIIIGTRGGQRMPHPTLVGGSNPQVQAAGMIEIRGGKIYSINNASGHFKPSIESLEVAEDVFSILPQNIFSKDFQGYLPYGE